MLDTPVVFAVMCMCVMVAVWRLAHRRKAVAAASATATSAAAEARRKLAYLADDRRCARMTTYLRDRRLTDKVIRVLLVGEQGDVVSIDHVARARFMVAEHTGDAGRMRATLDLASGRIQEKALQSRGADAR